MIIFIWLYNVRVIIFTIFAAEQSHATRMLRGATDYAHPPAKSVFAFGSEKVDVILELQLKNEVFFDRIVLIGFWNAVTEQRQTGQGQVILERLVEEQAEIGEHDPQLLPAIAVFKLAQQKTA